MPAQALPYVALLGFFYGSTMIASRFSVGQYEPTVYIGLRLTLASLGFLVVYALSSKRRWPTNRRLWRYSIVLGVIGTVIPMTSFVSALQFQSSGVTSLLITTNPALTVLLAHFLLPDESLTWRKSLGVALAMAGAALLVVSGESGLPDVSQADPRGYVLALLGITSSSISMIYTRKYMRDLDAFDVTSIRMFTAALVIVPLTALFVGFDFQYVDGQGVLAMIYAAVFGTVLAMMFGFYNIKRFGASASAMSSYFVPIVAGIGGALLLGEDFTGVMLVGMVIIIAGIALLNQRDTVPEEVKYAEAQ